LRRRDRTLATHVRILRFEDVDRYGHHKQPYLDIPYNYWDRRCILALISKRLRGTSNDSENDIVSFLAYSYGERDSNGGQPYLINLIDLLLIQQDVEKQNVFRCVCVCIGEMN
jgi:hypothetical protein